MFASTEQDHISSSIVAGNHLKVWERALALRVSLQKPLDTANSLPAHESFTEGSSLVINQLKTQIEDLSGVLNQQVRLSSTEERSKKRKMSDLADPTDTLWASLMESQNALQTACWEPVLNKWHSRLNFGSENTKAKLRVFTQTMWDQVDNMLEDEHRTVVKSRVPWAESRRMGREEEGLAEAERKGSVERYDSEVYDDRMFYSMLLKTFILSTTGSAQGNGGGTDGLGATMRAGDLEALRQYKRKKLNVERKASKGRKVRYNVHDKLQNFMFPVGHSGSSMDAEKLFQSLFQ